MSVPEGPVLGPCEAWLSGDAVAACCPDAVPGTEGAEVLDEVAVVASMLAFELSGRQFTGLCEKTVRPCGGECSCGPSRPSGSTWGWAEYGPLAYDVGWSSGGCGCLSTVRLSGYPVREVTEVKIDGAVIDPSEYRLDGWRELIRMDDPGPPVRKRRWPSSQNLALDDDQPNTFSVAYLHGVDPPQLGRDAAAQLACELWKACPGNAGECALPSRVRRVVRQGITLEMAPSIAEMLRSGSTGLQLLDAFIAGYNQTGRKRSLAVWSPEVAPFAREVGS